MAAGLGRHCHADRAKLVSKACRNKFGSLSRCWRVMELAVCVCVCACRGGWRRGGPTRPDGLSRPASAVSPWHRIAIGDAPVSVTWGRCRWFPSRSRDRNIGPKIGQRWLSASAAILSQRVRASPPPLVAAARGHSGTHAAPRRRPTPPTRVASNQGDGSDREPWTRRCGTSGGLGKILIPYIVELVLMCQQQQKTLEITTGNRQKHAKNSN